MSIDLNTLWFALVGVLLAGYAILDGFDLGVGALHLFTKSDAERRVMINSIGPVWDGNEVWLVTGGGALFAAFPEVYATSFSGFYLAMMLLLLALIFRAVALEFRSKRESKRWRQTWDVGFSIGSTLGALLLGVALGNIAWGVPLDQSHVFTGSFLSLLNPYAVLVGITTVALFVMHGSIYLTLKTEGELLKRVTGWINKTTTIFIICYVALTVVTMLFVPHMTLTIREHPWLYIIPILNVLVIVNILREIRNKRYFRAFLSSCATLAALLLLFAVNMYPNLILSSPDAANSLTIYNGASSEKTLEIMAIIALIGMPLVIAYTSAVYWIFRGKVKLDNHSY
ncbi:MAG TPA: cytochrome d ubiquinol oxidase subunit II [candidate division Zixibacteria bacterium]|nr:cytochrome d ubiquinol oxidase subunit II [candidate division Zixibacteria bacterium]